MTNRNILLCVTVIAMLTLSAGVVLADEVTSSINYRGSLTDSSGSPLSGTYAMTFRLYEAATGGTALATDIQDVVSTDGLFNTEIDFDQSYFDGRALWLGVKVGADPEMTPRQESRPVPYALSLVPGARIVGNTSYRLALQIENKAVRGDGVCVKTNSRDSRGFLAFTQGDYSDGVYACTTGYGSPGVYAETCGDDSQGVCVHTTGYNSDGVVAYSRGNGGYFVSSGYTGKGVYGNATGTYGEGVYGKHALSGNYGRIGSAWEGVRGCSPGCGRGVVGVSETGEGVGGFSANGYGVYGKGRCGGYFTTNQAGGSSGIDGTVKDYAGVMVSTDYDCTDGVHVTTTGENSDGVSACTTGIGSDGVRAVTSGDNSYGVYTYIYGDDSAGVYAGTTGDNSYGVYAYSCNYHGIYAETGRSDHKYGMITPDKMCAMSYDTGCADVAEYFPAPEDPEPGTVMVIDPAGGSKLRASTNAYDTTVAGIVSTEPGVSLGTKEDGNDGEKLIAVAGRVPCKVDASYAPVTPGNLLTTSDTPGHAMKAQPVEIGGIEIYRPGTTIGKALEPLDGGTGTIEVLVTLQ